MIKLVQKTATGEPDGRMAFSVPELPPGTAADVIVVVPTAAATARQEPTIAERLAALDAYQQSMNLSAEQVEQWLAEVKLERLAWTLPGDAQP